MGESILNKVNMFPISVANGGTGATNSSNALSALGAQPHTDNSLNTTSKTVPGAINEIKSSLGTVAGLNTGTTSGTIPILDTNGKLNTSVETDPTVPSWAKASTKPSYTFSEIGSTPTTLSGYGITDSATSTQGSKADSAIQGVKCEGTLLTPDSSKIVNITYSSLGTLSVSNGGTGATTFTSGNILVGSGTSAITSVASVPVGNGGTGATTASGARTNLGVVTEYGTWTPTIGNSATTQPTISNYYNQKGDYYVIGKLVYISCAVKFRCSAYGDTYACINGLPYASTTVTTEQALARSIQYYATNTTAYPNAIIRAGESFILLKDQGGFGYCTWMNYDNSHDQYIGFSGCYLKA